MNLIKKLREIFATEVPAVRHRIKMLHPSGSGAFTLVVAAQVWEGRWQTIREVPVTSGRDVATAISMANSVIEEYQSANINEKGVVV